MSSSRRVLREGRFVIIKPSKDNFVFLCGGRINERAYIQNLQSQAPGMDDEAQGLSGGERRPYRRAGHLTQGLQPGQVDVRRGAATLQYHTGDEEPGESAYPPARDGEEHRVSQKRGQGHRGRRRVPEDRTDFRRNHQSAHCNRKEGFRNTVTDVHASFSDVTSICR